MPNPSQEQIEAIRFALERLIDAQDHLGLAQALATPIGRQAARAIETPARDLRGGSHTRLTMHPLIGAVILGNLPLLKALLLAFDPKLPRYDGVTALMLAVARSNSEEAEAFMNLLLPGSDPRARDSLGLSALHHAARAGHEACVAALLPLSNPDAREKDGCTPLMYAAKQGCLGALKLLLPESDPLAKSSRDTYERNAAQIAIRRGHHQAAAFLAGPTQAALDRAALNSVPRATPASPAPRL